MSFDTLYNQKARLCVWSISDLVRNKNVVLSSVSLALQMKTGAKACGSQGPNLDPVKVTVYSHLIRDITNKTTSTKGMK